jgi:XTP/dITP diphosphohydrolase
MKIVFATNNAHKLSEVRRLLAPKFTIVSLHDIGFHQDIPEPHDNLTDNALEKARTIYLKYGINCFAEDTGLEIAALNNEPGVYSARYAGPQRSANDNINLVLKNLAQKNDRRARFRTVAALIWEDKEYTFEGIVNGTITTQRHGSKGFGYDPIFMPNGYTKTFAQLSPTEKNAISHRARAINKLVAFFKEL